jgi:hypothetical protein
MNSIKDIIKSIEELKNDLTKLQKENEYLKKEVNKQKIIDTRHTNELPSYYRKKGQGEYKEFKTTSILNINEKGFVMLETIVPWNDKSGGKITQIAYCNVMLIRKGSESDNVWNKWDKFN